MPVFRPIYRAIKRANYRPLTDPGVGGGLSSVFADGSTGAFASFRDTSVLYQDAGGATPVTTPGQSVRLILDKSRGLALGAETLTNGDFSNGLTGWSSIPTAPATVTVSGGAAVLDTVGLGGICRLRQTLTVTANQWFEVSFDAVAGSAAFATVQMGSAGGGSDYGQGVIVVGQRNRFVGYVTGTTLHFSFYKSDSSGSLTIDNVSVRPIAGNHIKLPSPGIYQIDSEGNPYVALDGTASHLTIPGSSSSMKFLHDGTGGCFFAALAITSPLVAGRTYPVLASSTSVNTSIGAYLAAVDGTPTFADSKQLFTIVTNGAAAVISGSNNGQGSVRGDGIAQVFGYTYLTQADGDQRTYVDGASFNTARAEAATPTSSSSAFDVQIGRSNGANYMSGRLYGFVIASKQPSDSERRNIVSYLRSLYGESEFFAAIGDSYTYNSAYSYYMQGHYPQRIEAELRALSQKPATLNYGISGNTSGNMISRVGNMLEQGAPEFAIVYSGYNDINAPSTVQASPTPTATVFSVAAGKGVRYSPGAIITVGGVQAVVASVAVDAITLTAPLAGAPAAGTAVNLDTTANVTGIVQAIKAAGCARVLVAGVHYCNFASGGDTTTTQLAYCQDIRNKQIAAAAASSSPYVDLYDWMRDLIVAGTYTQGDDLAWHVSVGDAHLNLVGEQILADAIYATMVTQGWA